MKHIAIVTLKTLTPLKIGTSKVDFLQDMPVNRDFNGLPFIQGSSIAGVLRKKFQQRADEIFGYEKEKGDEGEASKVKISNALLVDEKGKVHEKLIGEKSKFLKIFDNLPVREHTAINHRGVAKEHSKYDEEVVFRGAKFRFMIEYEGDWETFEEILEKINTPSFRLGGRTTNGFGNFKAEKILYESMDNEKYAEFKPSLNTELNSEFTKKGTEKDYKHYRLCIKPESFFIFGNGEGDSEADLTELKEHFVDYENGGLGELEVVIPASSVKGALSHRVAFYYNLEEKNWAEKRINQEKETNPAVIALFGEKKHKKRGSKGKVYISEAYKREYYEKVFDHVKIDRFTGGAVDTALFNEKAVLTDEIIIDVYVKDDVEQRYLKLLEKAFDDVVNGMLPLGYGVNKGHGVFLGKWEEV